ncbi:MAG: hypothetical protein R3E39_08040 [Anaerolineae bacterium]
MDTKYTLKLIDIRCNSARKLGGDTISILIAGQKMWVNPDIQFHPQHIHYVNFEDGSIRTKDGAEAILRPALTCPSIQVDSLPAVLKLETRTFLKFSETIGRVIITPICTQSKVVHQRIVMDGADYCISYALLCNS